MHASLGFKSPLWWMLCLLGKQQAEINGAANNQNRPREVTTNHSKPREVTTNQSRSREVTANQNGNQSRPREMTTNHDIQSHSNAGKIAADTSRVQVKITGMSCSSCVNKIESTLSSKKGKIYVCYTTWPYIIYYHWSDVVTIYTVNQSWDYHFVLCMWSTQYSTLLSVCLHINISSSITTPVILRSQTNCYAA